MLTGDLGEVVDPIQQQERLHQPTSSCLRSRLPQHSPNVLDPRQDVHPDFPFEPPDCNQAIEGPLLHFVWMAHPGMKPSVENGLVENYELLNPFVEQAVCVFGGHG